MIKLECKGVYDSLHIILLLSGTHVSQLTYNIYLIDSIDVIDLIDFYKFKHLILRNYLTDFNETYTCYRRECAELIYQLYTKLF